MRIIKKFENSIKNMELFCELGVLYIEIRDLGYRIWDFVSDEFKSGNSASKVPRKR